MSVFREFEREVLRILLAEHLPAAALRSVLDDAVLESYENTGAGYLLNVKHPALPTERRVCNQPMVRGADGGVSSGFVVFLEDHRLTLECHSWGLSDVPESFRDQDVRISVPGGQRPEPQKRSEPGD